jgi:hypothetical protein
MTPLHVTVISSDAPIFATPNKTYTFTDYEMLAHIASQDAMGPLRNRINVVFDTGTTMEAAMELGPSRHRCFQDFIGNIIGELNFPEDALSAEVLLSIAFTRH